MHFQHVPPSSQCVPQDVPYRSTLCRLNLLLQGANGKLIEALQLKDRGCLQMGFG
jgi:hypothetical protein